MKEKLTLTDLQEWAVKFLEKSEENTNAHTTFTLMHNIGCRASETRQENFVEYGERNYLLITKKRNFDRIIEISRIPENFRICIENRNMELALSSYSTIEFYLNRYAPYQIFNRKKECSTHIFRHIYAKNLKEIGFTMEEIQADLGEKNIASIFQYVYSELFRII